MEASIYERIGGEETLRRLVDEFYARVEQDPVLRPVFPDDLEPGKEWQSVGTADTTIATNVQVGLLLCVQHCKEEGAAVFSGLKLTKQAE